MPRFASWLLVLLLLGVFAAVTYGVLRARAAAGRGLPAYSVFSEAGDGLGEAADHLRRLGWTPVAVTRPIQNTQHRGLLVVVEPEPAGLLGEEGGLSEAEARAMLRWVGQGNTLLLCSRENTGLHRALGVTVIEDARGGEGFSPVELDESGGYTEGIRHLSVGTRATLQTGGKGLPLWWLGDRPGAVLLDHGAGRVLLVADPVLLTWSGRVHPDGKPRDDNALFLVNVAAQDARDNKVYFDEYHHGFHSASGFWGYLGYYGQRWALVPVLIVVGAAAWAWAVRLGPAVPTARPPHADAVDYASALARLYQRTGARRLLGRALVRNFLGALTRHLRLRPTALPAVILAAWRQHHPTPAPGGGERPDRTAGGQGSGPAPDRLQTLLRGVGDLRRGAVTDRQLLAWARAFDQFTHEVEEAQGARPRTRARH